MFHLCPSPCSIAVTHIQVVGQGIGNEAACEIGTETAPLLSDRVLLGLIIIRDLGGTDPGMSKYRFLPS
jgi:hypothetical protein